MFRKEHSVFEPWHEDTPEGLQAAAQLDLDSIITSLAYLIKDANVRMKTIEYLTREFEYLKLVFLHAACHSNYPYLSWYEYGPLAEDMKLFEGGVFKQSNLDVIYKTCCRKPMKGEKKGGLCRPEFLESIVRIAKHKYFDSGDADDMRQACEFLVEKNFKKYLKLPMWQTFRDRELWTLEVNDVFYFNYDKLYRLWKRDHRFDK